MSNSYLTLEDPCPKKFGITLSGLLWAVLWSIDSNFINLVTNILANDWP